MKARKRKFVAVLLLTTIIAGVFSPAINTHAESNEENEVALEEDVVLDEESEEALEEDVVLEEESEVIVEERANAPVDGVMDIRDEYIAEVCYPDDYFDPSCNPEKFIKTDKGWRDKTWPYGEWEEDLCNDFNLRHDDKYGDYFVDRGGYLRTGWGVNWNGGAARDYKDWQAFLLNGIRQRYWLRLKEKNGQTRIYYLKDSEPNHLGQYDTDPITGWCYDEFKMPLYFNETGEWGDPEYGDLRLGWYEHDSHQYYVTEFEGFFGDHILTDTVAKIDGQYYYFDQSGHMQTDWAGHLGRDTRYADQVGCEKTGWVTYGDNRYYFGQDSFITTGRATIDGKEYYFEEQGPNIGALREDKEKPQPDNTTKGRWVNRNGHRYFYDENGKMKTGWLTYKNNRYYFNKNGKMKTGWLTYKKHRYYFNKNGKMKTGWLTYKDNRYYLKKNGKMASAETLTINGKKYTFAKNGKLIKK